MRILLWSEHFSPYVGGVERSATLLLPELRKRGYEIVVVTSHHYLSLPDEEIWYDIPLYRFDFSHSLGKGDLVTWKQQQKRLAHLVDSFNPHLHHIFSIGPIMMACLQILKRQPAPLMAALVNINQRPEETYGPNGVIAKTLTSATWVTTVSQAILEQTIHFLPETKSHISVLYSGYPVPSLAPMPLAKPSRLLLLGRLVEQKGGELAIAAFAQIYQRYPDVRLIIAGDGPEREPWQKLAGALGDRVEFIGWRDPAEVYALLNSVTMVLMPSRWEGVPLVAIESALMARPTVATRIPGMSEIIVDGETGLLVEPGNATEFAKAIATLLDNPDRATAMGLTARARVGERFGLDRFVLEHESLYQWLVGER